MIDLTYVEPTKKVGGRNHTQLGNKDN